MSPDEEIATYSLWLIPDNRVFQELESLISNNQRRVKEPAFVPHVTLLSGISAGSGLYDRFFSIGRATAGFSLRCRQPRIGSDYYHCLFIPLVASDKLRQLRKDAENLFSFSSTRPFQPHISLMYHNPESALVNEQIKILPDFSTWEIGISKIELWNTTGPVGKWRCKYCRESF